MAKKTFLQDQVDTLNNLLRHYEIPYNYFIFSTNYLEGKTTKHKFAISSKNESGGIVNHTTFMSLGEMSRYVEGYYKALNNPFK